MPFPLGVPPLPDGFEIDAGDQKSVCFSKDAEPYIVGMLKHLADPRCYRGAHADILNMCNEMGQLPGLIVDGCLQVPVDFFPLIDTGRSVVVWRDYGKFVDSGGTTFFLEIAFGNPLYYTFQRFDSPYDLVGGEVSYLHVTCCNGSGFISVAGIDCLDNPLVSTTTGQWDLSDWGVGTPSLKELSIVADDTVIVELRTTGPIQCSSA